MNIRSPTRRRTMMTLFCSFLVLLLVQGPASVRGQTRCDQPIRCGERFSFASECLQVDGDKYIYPFRVACEVSEPSEPILAIVERTEIRGSLVTSASALQEILGLTVGRHCGLRLFVLRNLAAKIFLVGNADNPIVVRGTLMPSWCVEYDGRALEIKSIMMNYTLEEVPDLFRSILNNESVRSTVDEEVSTIVEGTSFDILELLSKAN